MTLLIRCMAYLKFKLAEFKNYAQLADRMSLDARIDCSFTIGSELLLLLKSA